MSVSYLSSGDAHETHHSMLSCLLVCPPSGPVKEAVLLRYHEWSCPVVSRRHNPTANFLVLWFLPSIWCLWCSLSIGCMGCIVDFCLGTKQLCSIFPCILASSGFSWRSLSVVQWSFFEEQWELPLPVGIRISIWMNLGIPMTQRRFSFKTDDLTNPK